MSDTWDDWEFEEDDPSILELDDPDEEPKAFTAEEVASLFPRGV